MFVENSRITSEFRNIWDLSVAVYFTPHEGGDHVNCKNIYASQLLVVGVGWIFVHMPLSEEEMKGFIKTTPHYTNTLSKTLAVMLL